MVRGLNFANMSKAESVEVMNRRGIRVYKGATVIVDHLSGSVLAIDEGYDEYIAVAIENDTGGFEFVIQYPESDLVN